ncbi:MAG: AIR synthase-related protein, partial [Thermomicrobium sp.]|nr:AIR synthase-related protein [Thermomicrobium sp.]
MSPGDLVLGLPSSGLHTNGYSLARACLGLTGEPEHDRPILQERPDWSERSLGELLLEPHRCYLPVLREWLTSPALHGLAHITGGGIVENVARIVPPGCRVTIDARAWPVPQLFIELQRRGGVPTSEMYRVFNMGIGFVVIGEPFFIEELQRELGEGWIIGEVDDRVPPRVMVRLTDGADAVLTDAR